MPQVESDKLKIGLVLDDGLDKPDGVQQYMLAIGSWLTQQGHTVHYLVGETTRTDIPGVHSLSRNIRVISNGNRLSIPLPTSRRKLREFLRREQFDVLHVQTPYSPFMGGQLVTLADARTAVVGTFHILPDSRFISIGNRLLGLWCRRSLRRFDTMLSVSTAARNFARATFSIDSQVLPNVVDYKRFHQSDALPQYAGSDNVQTILFLGRLVPRKGCQLLLEALVILRSRGGLPSVRVMICGRGPLEASLKRYATENDLDEIVEFTGFISEADKPRYYASADIAVFPSRGGESFGIVLLEAMAAGRAAVLAGDNPGYRSVMLPRADLLFNPQSAESLASQLERLLINKTDRNKAAAWGAKYAADFDVAVVGSKLEAIYRQALRKRRKV